MMPRLGKFKKSRKLSGCIPLFLQCSFHTFFDFSSNWFCQQDAPASGYNCQPGNIVKFLKVKFPHTLFQPVGENDYVSREEMIIDIIIFEKFFYFDKEDSSTLHKATAEVFQIEAI